MFLWAKGSVISILILSFTEKFDLHWPAHVSDTDHEPHSNAIVVASVVAKLRRQWINPIPIAHC